MNQTSEQIVQDLKEDLRAVVGDTEELLKATAQQSGEQIHRIRARAEESLRGAHTRLRGMTDAASTTVQDNPWAAIGVAAGVGLLLGLYLGRK